MRKLKSVLITMILAGLPLFASAEGGGQGVGSGGDALRQLMEQARWAALGRMSAIDWCSFSPTTSPTLAQWILQHLNDFKTDLQHTNHLWVVDAQSTCGFTQHSSAADIYFSYPTCAATVGNNMNSALFTLLHETAHHLGIDDEKQADLVAQGILNANIAIKCPAATQDVFNPLVCQGPVFSATDAARYLQPGASTTGPIGNYQAYAHSRSCNHLTGCGGWSSDKIYYYGERPLADVAVILNAESNTPYFSVDVVGHFSAVDGVYGYSETKDGLVSGIPGQLKYNGSYWHTEVVSYNNNNYKTTGELRQSCGWFKVQSRTGDAGDGTYKESEIVIYGQH